jgi:hypothetical protein
MMTSIAPYDRFGSPSIDPRGPAAAAAVHPSTMQSTMDAARCLMSLHLRSRVQPGGLDDAFDGAFPLDGLDMDALDAGYLEDLVNELHGDL